MDCSFITERVATGAAIATNEDVTDLVALGVTHVIDARAEFDDAALLMASDPGMLYLWDPAEDDGQPKPADWFKRALCFAMPALARPGNIVLTHCAAGVNRGPSLCYCILRALGSSAIDAINLLHARRPATSGGIRYSGDAEIALKTLGWIK